MMKDTRRITLHTATVVIRRDRAYLMHGEPACRAKSYPGCTTSVDVMVTCPKCTEILEQEERR